MSDFGSQTIKYWNGMLSTGTASGYSAFVNFDIAPPPYSFHGKKARPTGFYLKKRKGYNNVLPPKYVKAYKDWEVTDIVTLNDEGCSDGECINHIMLVNRKTLKSKVLVQKCNDCYDIKNLCGGTAIQGTNSTGYRPTTECDECFCPCQFDKFLVTDFVKGTPRTLFQTDEVFQTSGRGVQENTNGGTVGTFYDEQVGTLENVKVGDWIYVYGTSGEEGSAFCGQARQVVGKKPYTSTRPYDVLILNAPWIGIGVKTQDELDEDDAELNRLKEELSTAISSGSATDIANAKQALESHVLLVGLEGGMSQKQNQKGTGAIYSVYPERGEVLAYATCEGLKIIHSLNGDRDGTSNEVIENDIANTTTVCTSFQGDTCTYSVNEFNGKINLLGSKGYNISGGFSYDKFNFSVDNLNYVGEDKTSQTVFRNFLVQFGKENIGVIVYDNQGNSFAYKLDASVGIFSRTAFTTFQNSLYIIGSDRRLYSVSIQSNGANGFMLTLEDQSKQIKGDLDLLREGDEVNMSADGSHIYLFINNKHRVDNSDNTKTRILKYYRDYNRWVYHDLCCGIIKGKKGDYFLGDGIYTNSNLDYDCMTYDEDAGDYMGGNFFTAYIEAYIGENEDGETVFTTFAEKQLLWMKILLGRGIYTDGSTKIVIDYSNHGYQQQYQIDKFEHIEWIDKNNKIFQGISNEVPSDCALDVLAECTNVVRPCKGQPDSQVSYEQIGCKLREVKILDNCMCLDDRAYELSETYNLYLNLNHLRPSNLYKIRIMSTNGDEMYFGGFIAGVDAKDIKRHDSDNEDLINDGSDCCVEGKFIDVTDPCHCNN